MAPDMLVHESDMRGASASAEAQASAPRWSAIRVQGSTRRWYSKPAHST